MATHPTKKGQSNGEHWVARQNLNWTPEEAEQVKTWWTVDRLSSTQIGKLLGRTRNSVIGRVNRMGLSGTKPESYLHNKRKKKSARLNPPRGSAIVAARSAKVPSPPGRPPHPFNGGPGRTEGDGMKDTKAIAGDPPIERRKTLIHLKYHHCRWPLGTPTLFCGRTRIERSSYCEAHDRRSRRTG